MGANHEKESEGLVWISEIGKPDVTVVRFNRRKVRQQAMRHVIATSQRKKRKQPTTFKFVDGAPKVNATARKEEADMETEEAQPEAKATKKQQKPRTGKRIIHSPKRAAPRLSILHKLAETGYATARLKYQFDILDLSTLTSIHMGRPAAIALHNSRSQMRNCFQVRGSSLLDFVPQLYPASPLLRSAVGCVLARAQRILCPNARLPEVAVFSLYDQALRELQEALNQNTTVFQPNMLFAVQIMQLFEVLDFTQPEVWTRHTSGIAKLIHMRGPLRYETTFERSLLCSQLGTTFGESLHQNEDCFLGEPEWQHTLREMVAADDLNYSATVIDMWSLEVLLPRLVRQTSGVIICADHDAEAVTMLTLGLLHFRSLNFQWTEKALAGLNLNERDESLAVSYGGIIIANKAIVALNPLHPNSTRFEEETMELVEELMVTANRLRETAARGDTLIARTIQGGEMALACQEDFKKATGGHPDYVDARTGRVTLRVWEHFENLMGRQVVPGFIKRETFFEKFSKLDAGYLPPRTRRLSLVEAISAIRV